MAGKRITEMPVVNDTLTGEEILEAVQDGENRKVELNKLKEFFQISGGSGASAYEVAVQNGFEGTVEEWLASLKGEPGPKGETGSQGPHGPQGSVGPQGPAGKSAYQLAVEKGGYTGTEEQFAELLASIETILEGGGGSSGESKTLTFDIVDFAANNWTGPAGTTMVKEYSDSSIKIVHNQGKYPTGWYGYVRDQTPWSSISPSPVQNMQVVDLNTVIITSVGGFTSFVVNIHF